MVTGLAEGGGAGLVPGGGERKLELEVGEWWVTRDVAGLGGVGGIAQQQQQQQALEVQQ